MSKVTFDYSKACGFVQDHEMQYMSELAEQAKEKLLARTGAGNDFLGWIDLPVDYDKDEFDRIKKAAEKIREDSDLISEQERQSNFSDTLLRTLYQKK